MPKPSRYRGDRAERLALSTYLKLTRASERLWNHLAPMCQRDLGERILRSSGNMTLVIDNLEKRGLVRRERSVEDRRFIQVHLTEEGARLIRRVFPAHADAITRQLAVLTQEEQRALGNLCRKLGTVA